MAERTRPGERLRAKQLSAFLIAELSAAPDCYCVVCRRAGWGEAGGRCSFPQPNGSICPGHFVGEVTQKKPTTPRKTIK